jgi:hypothetical protein
MFWFILNRFRNLWFLRWPLKIYYVFTHEENVSIRRKEKIWFIGKARLKRVYSLERLD